MKRFGLSVFIVALLSIVGHHTASARMAYQGGEGGCGSGTGPGRRSARPIFTAWIDRGRADRPGTNYDRCSRPVVAGERPDTEKAGSKCFRPFIIISIVSDRYFLIPLERDAGDSPIPITSRSPPTARPRHPPGSDGADRLPSPAERHRDESHAPPAHSSHRRRSS